MNQIRIKLEEDKYLVAEADVGSHHSMPVIFIGIEKNGIWFQDLAFIRESFYFDQNKSEIRDKGNFDVAVYGDCYSEDYTDMFQIQEYEEEEK